jgi:hypothetical protein
MAEPTHTTSRRGSLWLAFSASLLVAAARLWPRRSEPRFAERTAPGNRYRTFPLGEHPLYIREDLLRSGWFREFRFHDKRKVGR